MAQFKKTFNNTKPNMVRWSACFPSTLLVGVRILLMANQQC